MCVYQNPGSKKDPNSTFPKDFNTAQPFTCLSGVTRGLRVVGAVAPDPPSAMSSREGSLISSWCPTELHYGWGPPWPHAPGAQCRALRAGPRRGTKTALTECG